MKIILTYSPDATTGLRSWPASGVSETAHGLSSSSAIEVRQMNQNRTVHSVHVKK